MSLLCLRKCASALVIETDDMEGGRIFGDGVEREIIAIAQEALTNAVRHSRARRITITASTALSMVRAVMSRLRSLRRPLR